MTDNGFSISRNALLPVANYKLLVSQDNGVLKPFWRPIDQCPKVLGQYYLAINAKSRSMLVVRWDDYYGEWNSADRQPRYDDDFTHYAEIPALEADDFLETRL